MFDWRPMGAADLPAVLALADLAHPELPEGLDVMARRLWLFPAGCLVLAAAEGLVGYAFSHPIRAGEPPALNEAPAAIPVEANQFYLHDLVLSPAVRGGGHSSAGVNRLLAIGSRYASSALISVYGTAGFWGRFGFQPASLDRPDYLDGYGAGAVFMTRANTSPGSTPR